MNRFKIGDKIRYKCKPGIIIHTKTGPLTSYANLYNEEGVIRNCISNHYYEILFNSRTHILNCDAAEIELVKPKQTRIIDWL